MGEGDTLAAYIAKDGKTAFWDKQRTRRQDASGIASSASARSQAATWSSTRARPSRSRSRPRPSRRPIPIALGFEVGLTDGGVKLHWDATRRPSRSSPTRSFDRPARTRRTCPGPTGPRSSPSSRIRTLDVVHRQPRRGRPDLVLPGPGNRLPRMVTRSCHRPDGRPMTSNRPSNSGVPVGRQDGWAPDESRRPAVLLAGGPNAQPSVPSDARWHDEAPHDARMDPARERDLVSRARADASCLRRAVRLLPPAHPRLHPPASQGDQSWPRTSPRRRSSGRSASSGATTSATTRSAAGSTASPATPSSTTFVAIGGRCRSASGPATPAGTARAGGTGRSGDAELGDEAAADAFAAAIDRDVLSRALLLIPTSSGGSSCSGSSTDSIPPRCAVILGCSRATVRRPPPSRPAGPPRRHGRGVDRCGLTTPIARLDGRRRPDLARLIEELSRAGDRRPPRPPAGQPGHHHRRSRVALRARLVAAIPPASSGPVALAAAAGPMAGTPGAAAARGPDDPTMADQACRRRAGRRWVRPPHCSCRSSGSTPPSASRRPRRPTSRQASGATVIRDGRLSILETGTRLQAGDEVRVDANGQATITIGSSEARLAGGADLRIDVVTLGPDHRRPDRWPRLPSGRHRARTTRTRSETASLDWVARGTAFDIDPRATRPPAARVTLIALQHGVTVSGPALKATIDEGRQGRRRARRPTTPRSPLLT